MFKGLIHLSSKTLGMVYLISLLALVFAQSQITFLRVPYGWLWFLLGFIVINGGIALAAYLYGRATRPTRAGQYALTAATHLFIWVVILLTFYPIVYLLAVSFNKNDSITTPLPKVGNIIFRSGVLPDPSNFLWCNIKRCWENSIF
ncbi:MAG: hypothetical protein R2865_17065 [Deinococcales bacterium]